MITLVHSVGLSCNNNIIDIICQWWIQFVWCLMIKLKFSYIIHQSLVSCCTIIKALLLNSKYKDFYSMTILIIDLFTSDKFNPLNLLKNDIFFYTIPSIIVSHLITIERLCYFQGLVFNKLLFTKIRLIVHYPHLE